MTAGLASGHQVVEAHPGLVVIGQNQNSGVHLFDYLSQCGGHRSLRVERTRRCRIPAFDALLGYPVMLRVIPGHDGLPHVVVGQIPMLVVRRVQVGQVERAKRTGHLEGVASYRLAGSVDQVGNP